MVRAAAVDTNVAEAVREGRRAVAIAEAEAAPALVAALGGYARALYLAGEVDAAWVAALRAVEHPDAARRAPAHAFARSTLALVAAERRRVELARNHAAVARSLVGAVGQQPKLARGQCLCSSGDWCTRMTAISSRRSGSSHPPSTSSVTR